MLFSVALQLRRLLRLLLLRATCLRRVCYMIATPLPLSRLLAPAAAYLGSLCVRSLAFWNGFIKFNKQQSNEPNSNGNGKPSRATTYLATLPRRTPFSSAQHRLHASSCASHTHRLHVSVCCALYPAASESTGKATAYRSLPYIVHIGGSLYEDSAT